MNKKKVIFWSSFILCFSLFLLLATFYDYEISELLADLSDGQYISSNLFGRIFETIGETVIYLFIAFAAMIIFLNCIKKRYKLIRYGLSSLFFLIAFAFLAIGFIKIGSYLCEHYPEAAFFKSLIYQLISIIFSLFLVILSCLLMNKKLSDQIPNLLSFAIVILMTAALSQAIVQGIKPLFGRERFRAIYYFETNHLSHPGFTKWYVMNGSSSKIASLYQVDKDYFKSFPSGHTCAAGMTYLLILIPKFFPTYQTKKWRWIFYVLPILYTGTVAISRIVMGAHYFSDVLIGGTVTFLSVFVSYSVYQKIAGKVQKKENKH